MQCISFSSVSFTYRANAFGMARSIKEFSVSSLEFMLGKFYPRKFDDLYDQLVMT